MKRTIEWAAGLFEGEGCITKSEGYYALQLGMTDEDVVRDFAEAVGYGNVNSWHSPSHKSKGYKKMYNWKVKKKSEVYRILEAMLPYLGNRRAYKALNCLDELDIKLYP